MNVSYYTSQVTRIEPSSIPGTLWAYYLEYLWYYEPDSWVARIAYSFRVLAFLVALPFIVLGLVDISSYVIARTLGVVDDVKASTSDKATVHMDSSGSSMSTPSIQINDAISNSSESAFSDTDVELHNLHNNNNNNNTANTRSSRTGESNNNKARSPLSDSSSSLNPSVFFSGDTNLKLSGVGVFSPAASQPPSPTVSRQNIPLNIANSENLRHRTHNASGRNGDEEPELTTRIAEH
ncbi:hypothetical protein D9613_000439 [Agrocybe pediades]|uniref:Uncharacterized protein n=1 Tax=Agrocybe pediades TaxID=84607 RepID=A0A8H4R0N9_9AGAR|nr:hypothetical protein D9613_000439 [Agrocybe pediades]